MNSNEFRVGNLIYNDRIKNAIIFIGFDSVQLITPQGNNITARIDLIKPIILTTEFLEKTELEQSGILYQKGKFAIKPWSVGGEIEWVIFWGDKAILYEKNYPVHRLQNLYFALSNEELQIK